MPKVNIRFSRILLARLVASFERAPVAIGWGAGYKLKG